jgi:hypothetical protein
MMFPGDKSMNAPGHEIYNCRCTTRTVEKDGIEAEPREMRVRNPEWEKAKAEEDQLVTKVDRLKEREQAETDPEKKKQLRRERIEAQKELSTATQHRQGIDKNVVVNEMNYSDWKNWKKGLENSDNSGIIKSISIGRSVGAASKNYPVKLLDSKQHTKLVEGQKIEGKTFAGKGTNTDIRERFRLEREYHIEAEKWEKVSGNGYVLVEGKKKKAELHWYEADGEIYEMKVKRYLDEG